MIRPATFKDLDSIVTIAKSVTIDNQKIHDPAYASKIQLQGFIPEGFATQEEFRVELEKKKVALIYEEDRKTLGFCIIRKEIYYPEEADTVIWVDEKAKQSYYHHEHSSVITYLLVHPNHIHQGIGSKLFSEAVQQGRELGIQDLFWITTLAPLGNFSSMTFITRQGFTHANFTMPSELFGLHNLQSVLYWKQYE